MREILFKAKRLDNGEWVYGYVGYKGKGTDLEECHIMQSTFNSTASPFAYPFYFTDIQVDPATVCQYTGLKDKNGVKIFEGDILNMHGGCAEMDVREYDVQCRVAYYKTGRGANIGFSGLYDSGMRADLMGEYCLTVIGNIHDNPETLKEAAKQEHNETLMPLA